MVNFGRTKNYLGDESTIMANPIRNKNIILGVTGSIAAYKAAELASYLTQQDAKITAILTQAAEQFISPLTFQSVTGHNALTEESLWGSQGHITHVQIARETDLMIIAPASANTIAKIAHGIADNLLTLTTLALQCPLIIAPAMDMGMYGHIATQENVKLLEKRGVHFIGPAEGHLASGLKGKGRMVEALEIAQYSRWLLSRNNTLKDIHTLVTAGGTREPLDPVRFLSNRSSGKQGFTIAQAALDAGANVTLISAPTFLNIPFGVNWKSVETAEEMYQSVMHEIENVDVLIMAAAVADFTPSKSFTEKIKKEKNKLEVTFNRTTDILTEAGKYKKEKKPDLILVGFAAETNDLINNAREKLKAKNLDMVVANDISRKDAGFEVDTNQVSILFSDKSIEEYPLMKKEEVAENIMEHIMKIFQTKKG